MITVYEGPDFAGKSTLAEASGARVVHNGPVPEGRDAEDWYTQQFLSFDPREDVVLDRAHVGELIYGPIFRGRSGLTWTQYNALTGMLVRLGARLVYVDTSDRVLRERFHSARGDDMVKEEDTLVRIAAQYRALLGSDPRWERKVTT